MSDHRISKRPGRRRRGGRHQHGRFRHGDPSVRVHRHDVIFSVLGLVITAAPRRFARRPRTPWLRTTVALTVLSFVPDMLADAAATKVLLMLTHVVAAAIVFPTVARRLS